MASVTVYAKERSRVPSNLPRNSVILDNAFLDVAISPPVPIHVGQQVRVQLLTKKRNHDGTLAPGYLAAQSGIEGQVVGIRTMELAITEFIVKNDNHRSTVGFAYLSVQHISGVTVRLNIWHTALRTILLPLLPHTRHIPLDRDVDVIPAACTRTGGRYRSEMEGAERQED